MKTIKIQRQPKVAAATTKPSSKIDVTQTEEMQQVLTFFTTEMMSAHEELLKRARKLEEANHRLEEIDELKTRLLGDVAHELRAPLTGMLLKLDLLERGKPENQPRYVEDLRGQVRRLGHMIENILDMTRIYMTNPAERFVEVDLQALLTEVIEQKRLLARQKDLTINYQTLPTPPQVRGEREQLERVFVNVIGNAIKYTLTGSIDIEVKPDPSRRMTCVTIRDTGIGIAAEDIPSLFDRFHRGKLAAQAGIDGSGLGLAIVKDIVEVHGGRIEVESTPGKGSTFKVHLPSPEK
jgi:signal transduction histidine kinase